MDIFEFAMEKEQRAEKFYRQLADKAEHAGFKNIFNMLADQEAEHYKTVQQMKASTPVTLTQTPVLANAKEIFEKMQKAAERFSFDISEAEVYRKATETERQSKKYYLEKAAEVDNAEQKKIFQQLAAEEEKHIVLVQTIGDFVAKPETFLENAEFTHFDDYADGEF
jgi:rubrerythrin